MPVPTSKGEQARADILDAANRLFLSKGYNGTSMRDIAETAGNRAVAGLYNHFPTKDAIFKALVEERSPYEKLIEMIEMGHGETAPEFIANVLRNVMPVMMQHIDFIHLIEIDLREFQGSNMKHLLEDHVFPRILEFGVKVQTLPGLKPHPPIVLMRMMASTAISFVLTQRLLPSTVLEIMPQQVWIETYIQTLLHGIAADSYL